jgi:hypothetical protein
LRAGGGRAEDEHDDERQFGRVFQGEHLVRPPAKT